MVSLSPQRHFKTRLLFLPDEICKELLQYYGIKDWPTGLRDIQVRTCRIFVIQGQVTPKLIP